MVKEVGWDDAFVVLAQASNTAATILVCICKLIMLAKCTWLTMPAVNYGLTTAALLHRIGRVHNQLWDYQGCFAASIFAYLQGRRHAVGVSRAPYHSRALEHGLCFHGLVPMFPGPRLLGSELHSKLLRLRFRQSIRLHQHVQRPVGYQHDT